MESHDNSPRPHERITELVKPQPSWVNDPNKRSEVLRNSRIRAQLMYHFDEYCGACESFMCKSDYNGDIVLTFCNHPENPSGYEGNTTKNCCPLIAEYFGEEAKYHFPERIRK